VICNQDEVIDFLFKNQIPFKSLIHYGHYALIYDGGDKYYQIPNLGNRALTYGVEDICYKKDYKQYQNLLGSETFINPGIG
jgi:hypothetical protein